MFTYISTPSYVRMDLCVYLFITICVYMSGLLPSCETILMFDMPITHARIALGVTFYLLKQTGRRASACAKSPPRGTCTLPNTSTLAQMSRLDMRTSVWAHAQYTKYTKALMQQKVLRHICTHTYTDGTQKAAVPSRAFRHAQSYDQRFAALMFSPILTMGLYANH